jgi:hypothetical protein
MTALVGSGLGAMEPDLDNLELELRKIEGVTGVGFDVEDGRLLVDVLVAGGLQPAAGLRTLAEERCRAHTDIPYIVAINGLRPALDGDAGGPATSAEGSTAAAMGGRPSRVRIDSIRPWISSGDDLAEVEVVLVVRGRQGRGRGRRDVAGVTNATIQALRSLDIEIPFQAKASEAPLPESTSHAVVVLLEGTEGGGRLYGVARAEEPEEAAARATLHALNRWLEPHILHD